MRRGVAYSLAFHAAVIVIAYFGVPHLSRPPVLEQPITVDIVTVDDKTNAPPPKPREEPKKEPEPPKPPPEPPKAQTPAPPPPPKPPEPAPQVAAKPPEPAPAPLAEPKPKPEPKEQAKPVPKPAPTPPPKVQPRLADIKPKKKPKPPDTMESVLKTLEDLKRQPPKKEEKPERTKKPAEPEKSFDVAEIQKALEQPRTRHDPSRPIAISEIDLVRRQIAACWNLPAGAKDARNMVVEIRVTMNPDGTVRDAQIQDTARLQSDPFYRAMAESAYRAVLNPRCQPFKLPPDRYDVWQTLALKFDPREML
jgi:outer membrane biosynthesis protein TonB